ncbi:hypothetical protein BC832DRAFT_53632 [Gaertneriomyces semiglobifer]|nr:hypothetical protein BC832DRAFT_53632 [Gaertneriomyces semiglobifer]
MHVCSNDDKGKNVKRSEGQAELGVEVGSKEKGSVLSLRGGGWVVCVPKEIGRLFLIFLCGRLDLLYVCYAYIYIILPVRNCFYKTTTTNGDGEGWVWWQAGSCELKAGEATKCKWQRTETDIVIQN